MTQIFPDTPPETERVLFALLREMPPWRNLEMVAQLNQTARELTLVGLRELLKFDNSLIKRIHVECVFSHCARRTKRR